MRILRLTLVQRIALLYGRSILARLMAYCLVGLFAGSVVLYLAEHRTNTAYSSYFQTLVNIVILFVSGFDVDPPRTPVGIAAAFSVLALGVCFLGMFTGEMAAYLVERRMKGNRGMKPVTVSNHVLITRWSKDTEAIIDELMSEDLKERRPVVVIDREQAEIPLDNPLVSFVRGDPTEAAVLERAGVARAHTAIILADPSSKDYNAEDSRSILTCLAIESLNRDVYTVVQILNPENQKHLERVHCDEVVCTTEVATQVVVQSSVNHGVSRLLSEVLSFGEGSEIYRARLARRFAGKEYYELGAELMTRHRVSLLAIDSDGTLHVNPEGEVRVKEGDHAFVLSPEHPKGIEDA